MANEKGTLALFVAITSRVNTMVNMATALNTNPADGLRDLSVRTAALEEHLRSNSNRFLVTVAPLNEALSPFFAMWRDAKRVIR